MYLLSIKVSIRKKSGNLINDSRICIDLKVCCICSLITPHGQQELEYCHHITVHLVLRFEGKNDNSDIELKKEK